MDILDDAAQRAKQYLAGIGERAVDASPAALAALKEFDEPMPEVGTPDAEVLEMLDRLGSPATIASNGPRFFGFVISGSLPATIASNWLATAWDQNAGLWAGAPVSSKLEEVALAWLRDLIGVDERWGGAFVTGATMANFTCLAAGRNALYRRMGHDVEKDGLYGAPELTVLVGGEAHPSLTQSLGMLGLGRNRVVSVPVDDQGRLDAEAIPDIDGSALVCLQAGNVNTGSFDPIDAVLDRVDRERTWVHVDAAFGFWACASSRYQSLLKGLSEVDSVCTDAHKWLNVPYDNGIAMVNDPEALRRAMSYQTSYLTETEHREPSHYTPELSRRGRGVDVWAALKALGRAGMGELVERNCRQARRFAEGLTQAGYTILNDVVLNQVLVSFGDAEKTRAVIDLIQKDGTCWTGPTQWQGRAAMRISVCCHSTTDADVERCLEAMIRCAGEI